MFSRIMAACCLFAMLSGCGFTPQPAPRALTRQQTLETADHWRTLAKQIVREMHPTPDMVFYVSEDDKSPFGRAFTTLFRHEVAASGAQLADRPTDTALVIDWGVQILKYASGRPQIKVVPGLFSLITGGGVGGGYIVNNHSTVFPTINEFIPETDLNLVHYSLDTEVIINVTGSRGGLVNYDFSGVFFMRRDDSTQYWERSPYRRNTQPMQEKTYSLVGE